MGQGLVHRPSIVMTEERDAVKTRKVEGGRVRVRDMFTDPVL